MTQQEREDILREFRAELEAERSKKHGDIERDSLNRQLAGQLTEKYNAKVRELKDEKVCI